MENEHHYSIVEKAINFIKNYHLEQPSLEEIANHVNLSKFHFQRVFRKWVGISPKDYLQFITIEKAKESLRKGISTLHTSYHIGLSGNSRLHDLFVKIEACTPGEFKKRGESLKIHYGEIKTPFGNAIIAETEKEICSFSFDNLSMEKIKLEYHKATFIEELSKNGKLAQKYFENWKTPTTPISLDLIGTPFQIQV